MSLIELHLDRAMQWLFNSWNPLEMTDNTNTIAHSLFPWAHHLIMLWPRTADHWPWPWPPLLLLWAPAVMRSLCRWRAALCALYSVLCTLLDHARTPHTRRGCCCPDCCSAAAHPNFNIFPFVVVNGWAADTTSRGTALLIRTNMVKTTFRNNTPSI